MIEIWNRKMDETIEAIQYDGTNIDEIDEWMGSKHVEIKRQDKALSYFQVVTIYHDAFAVGRLPIALYDYIVKADGQFYIWRPEFLKDKYERKS